jgi:hypothetical protein
MSIGVRRPVRAGLVALLCALAGGLAFGSAAALAAAPMVEGEAVVSVKATTATLSAQIDPFGLTTTYEFEYSSGGVSWLKAPEPAGSVSGEGDKTASAELSGLTPETKYEFRVVATNSAGETGEGVVETFTTAPTQAPGLPDGRGFERVSPVENDDANVYVPLGLPENQVEHQGEINTELPFQVATDGEAVAYLGDPTVGGTGERGDSKGNEYLARRSSQGGWTQTNINPPVYSAFYQAFSPDLTLGILQSGSPEEPEAPTLSPQAPGEGYANLYTSSLEGESYQPFFTTKASNRNSEEFDTAEVPTTSFSGGSPFAYAGASSNYERLLFEANGAFEETGAAKGSVEENNLYESVNSHLSLVNILPNGSTEADATFGAKAFSKFAFNPPDFSSVISEDGSRVFWTDLAAGPYENHIFVRENPSQPESPLENGACTVPADACTVPVSEGPARYWTASADGRYAFYTEGEGEESELYRFDIEGGPAGTREALTGPKAGVEGVLGEGDSETGQYIIYFVAKGVLASNKNSDGAEAEPSIDNLYVLREGGSPVFVAPLSEEDGTEAIRPVYRRIKNTGDWQPGLGHRTAEVTPGGGSLVFMSNDQKVEGHYEEVAGSGVSLEEVYVYDAETRALSCASCGGEHGVAPVETQESGKGLGAFIPVSNALTFQPTLISEDGSRVFFDSDEPLVPADTNGEQDVYEWERYGSGSCQESDGCVYLLSGGVSESSSWLIGTDEKGNNVFIVSREQLVSGPSNGTYDLYDARVGATPVATTACMGTGCQGVPSPPPTFATPPSLTFNGVGNFPAQAPVVPAVKPKAKPLTRAQKLAKALKACGQDKSRKKRAVCEARAHKRYGATSKAKSRKGGK